MMFPFVMGAWCPWCRRGVLIWEPNSKKVCPTCHRPPIKVLYRKNLRHKMGQVEAYGYRMPVHPDAPTMTEE
jgi:hypothetical protein